MVSVSLLSHIFIHILEVVVPITGPGGGQPILTGVLFLSIFFPGKFWNKKKLKQSLDRP